MVNPVKKILGEHQKHKDPGCYFDDALTGQTISGCMYWKTYNEKHWPSREAQEILNKDRRAGKRSFVRHEGHKHHLFREL